MWITTVIGWHVVFYVMLGIAATALVVRGDGSPTPWLLLLGLAAGYGVLAVPVARVEWSWRGRAYLGVLTAGLGALLAVRPDLNFLLFIAFPQTWFYSRDRREGTVWTVLLAVAATAGLAAAYGPGSLEEVAGGLGVSVLFSFALGWWITSIIEQSRERSELIAALESTREELARAHHDAGVAAERERFAREVHDTLAQSFTSIVLLAQTAATLARSPAADRPGALERIAERIDLVEETARDGLAEARTVVAAMTPVGLADATLVEALEQLAQRVGRESGVDVHLEVDGRPELGRAQEVVLLRAAQEALSNVRRHARARSARLRLVTAAGTTTLEVSDDGVGFDTVAGAERPAGYGLSGMLGRVADAGGAAVVDSAPGRGTRVAVTVPAGRGAP
ncbi:sensor histidine kinase [Kineococcus glutinatus]|uniref:Sensor histidine kinase n=1 Tax=Kineococcus glutinatus TaxID=1070872 RepID=A0ABP9HX72_9ACTN